MARPSAKSSVRTTLRKIVGGLSRDDRIVASNQVVARLTSQTVWLKARSCLIYSAIEFELDLSALMTSALNGGKQLALPAFDETTKCYVARLVRNPPAELASGQFGILEPSPDCPEIPLNQLDLLLVPGVAFNLCGHRIGRGRGYFDRLLAQAVGVKCGVAYDEQIQDELPAESHDILMDCLLTPTRWIECRPNRHD